MATRVAKALVEYGTPLEISSVSEKLQQVDFISFTSTADDSPVTVDIFSTTSDTSNFPNEEILLHTFKIPNQSTVIFNKDNFPTGDANSYSFGNHAADNRLFVRNNTTRRLIVHYSVTDVGVSADYTTEQLQDIVGAMVDGGTETNIAVTYDDTNGKLNFVSTDNDTVPDATNVAAAGALMDSEVTNLAQVKAFDSSDYATSAQGTKADTAHGWGNHGSAGYSTATGVENNADVTDTANVESSGALMDSELTDLAGVKGVTISTLQVKPSEGAFANGDKTKLDGIATGAEVNVQSDWNSASGDNQILNKPTIPAAYVDADAVSAVQAADDYLKNDASDTMAGALTLEGSLFLKDETGSTTTKSKIQNNVTTVNRTITVPDASGVMALTSDLPPAAVSTGVIKWMQAKVVLTEAQLNSMHSTAIMLIAHAGTDTIIMVGDAIALIDRDTTTAQSNSVDLCIGYNGTTVYSESILYERRFMYNENGDRTWSLKADYSGEVGGSLTAAVDKDVTAAFTGAITSGSLNSITLYIQYYIIDNS